MDIGRVIAYKRPAPQRGPINGGVKSHGEETQEGQEDHPKEVAPVDRMDLPRIVEVAAVAPLQVPSVPRFFT